MVARASRASLGALDWFNFFVAAVHAGFGPFVAVYLVSASWSQADIGFVLSASGLVPLLGQLPAGALVDFVRSERGLAACAIAIIGAGALIVGLSPTFPAVFAVCILYAAANCVLLPVTMAISLGLVGHSGMDERLARNARFSCFGGALAIAGMGLVGYQFPLHFVFLTTAALTVPALFALLWIRPGEIDPNTAHGAPPSPQPWPHAAWADMVLIGPLLVLAGGVMLFHFVNMPTLLLFSGMVVAHSARWATMAMAAAVLVSQAVAGAVSPWVGRKAGSWGRRSLFLAAFAILAVRVVTAGATQDPSIFIGLQVLDGCSAAIVVIVVPLMIADATQGSGHFGLAVGLAGTALAIGAAAGAACVGYVSDRFGSQAAWVGLAGVAWAGLGLMWAFMPETRYAQPSRV